MIASEHAPTLVIGTGAGIAIALFIALLLRGRYPTLQPLDVTAVFGVSALILTSGLVGALLPLHQMLRRDLSTALKEP